jgi:signal transduction histidine kinase
VSALEAFRNEFPECEMEIEFAHENIPSTLPADVTLCLLRIVQEGLHVIAGKAQNGTAAIEAARRTSAPSARLRDPLTCGELRSQQVQVLSQSPLDAIKGS